MSGSAHIYLCPIINMHVFWSMCLHCMLSSQDTVPWPDDLYAVGQRPDPRLPPSLPISVVQDMEVHSTLFHGNGSAFNEGKCICIVTKREINDRSFYFLIVYFSVSRALSTICWYQSPDFYDFMAVGTEWWHIFLNLTGAEFDWICHARLSVSLTAYHDTAMR